MLCYSQLNLVSNGLVDWPILIERLRPKTYITGLLHFQNSSLEPLSFSMYSVMMKVDIVIIGAGFSGLWALYKLREIGFNCLCVEALSDVGGIWQSTRYPGCRNDTVRLFQTACYNQQHCHIYVLWVIIIG